jgi:Protein of unknown function (DUF3102)
MRGVDRAVPGRRPNMSHALSTTSVSPSVGNRYDYSALDPAVVKQVQASAEKIRQTVKRVLEDVIEIGRDLIAVKDALPHGQFGPWIRAELGWPERTVRNFMGVAEVFGSKSAIIADLGIQPTAAYLLAAPSVPDEARLKAVERAQSGEKITITVARELVSQARTKGAGKTRKTGRTSRGDRLRRTLDRYREQWPPSDLSTLVRHLREFANELEGVKGKHARTGS